MFETARHGSWLDTIEEILYKMCNRISQLRRNIQNCSGIVPTIRGVLEDRWNNCAAFSVTDLSVANQTYNLQWEEHI